MGRTQAKRHRENQSRKKKKKKGRRKNRTENIRLILFICRCVPIHLSIHRILLPRRPLQILMGLVERLRHVLAGFLRWENSSQHPLLPSPPGTGLKRRWSGRRTHQLFQVPAADLHVAAVVVETLGEVPRVGLAGRGAPGAAALHLTVSVLGLNESVCGSLLWGSLFGSRSASATELQSTPQPSVSPAVLSRPVQCGGGERERERERGGLTSPEIPAPTTWPMLLPTATPAAVDAICPNSPGLCCAGADACATAGGGAGAVRAGTEAVDAGRAKAGRAAGAGAGLAVGRTAGRAEGRACPCLRPIVLCVEEEVCEC